jgi:hypothetical protein
MRLFWSSALLGALLTSPLFAVESEDVVSHDPTQATCGLNDSCAAKSCMDECLKEGDDEADCQESCVVQARHETTRSTYFAWLAHHHR